MHTPLNFSGSTPRNFWSVLGVTKSRPLYQAVLVETVETGTKNRCVIETPEGGGGGYSHTLPIRVCAAQRGRDFEAPDLERGIHFRGVF